MKRLTKRIGETIYANNINRDAYTNNEDLEQACIDKTNDIYTKLGQLEDIEEELGIDLITLFKAQKQGYIWELVFAGYDENRKSTYKPRKQKHWFGIDFRAKALIGKWIGYDFEDYGKTWALTKKELENDK